MSSLIAMLDLVEMINQAYLAIVWRLIHVIQAIQFLLSHAPSVMFSSILKSADEFIDKLARYVYYNPAISIFYKGLEWLRWFYDGDEFCVLSLLE